MQPQPIRAEPTALNYSTTYSFLLMVRALAELSYWQDCQKRYGIGEVTLSTTQTHWVVRVSGDLVKKVIPF